MTLTGLIITFIMGFISSLLANIVYHQKHRKMSYKIKENIFPIIYTAVWFFLTIMGFYFLQYAKFNIYANAIFIIIWGILTILIISHIYESLNEKANEQKINNEVERRYNNKLKELEMEYNQQIKSDFIKVVIYLKPLLQESMGYSFYDVFCDLGIGKEWAENELYDKYLDKFFSLKERYSAFRNHLENSIDWIQLRDELNSIIRDIELLTEHFSKEKKRWNPKLNKVILDKLIEEYNIFINKLKMFYKDYEIDNEPSQFRYISSFLRDC